MGGKPLSEKTPKSLAKACLFCRARKIRCDTVRPRCAACVTHGKECVYKHETPGKRPTLAKIHELQRHRSTLEAFINELKSASTVQREELLASTTWSNGRLQLPDDRSRDLESEECFSPQIPRAISPNKHNESPGKIFRRQSSLGSLDSSSDEEFDIGPFISVDDAGVPRSFGPSSALHYRSRDGNNSLQSAASLQRDHVRHSLIAKAALQRQSERLIASMPDIYGVPTELAMHLLDLHWRRQHHTFLLTYRPAIMRDVMCNGPHCSKFLLYAIFACSSKYSSRLEVRDDPSDSTTAGRQFFRCCDEILAKDSLLIYPTLPTVIGLLLLGSTFNSRGETSKGWLYTGYALRMIYDLGLHLDPKETSDCLEDVEVRRRVFWGAFICDKLQSLYLGRPVAINLRDARVSRDFMDTLEEQELYMPYMDPSYPDPQLRLCSEPSPVYSVSTFQQLCSLSKIMTKIINTFYVVGATPRNAQASLQLVDNALQTWHENLPKQLDYQPQFGVAQPANTSYPAPTLMNLHGIYHSLIILLHRPFISDGHLRSTATPAISWGRCTSAARSITSIALAWKVAYGLSGAPYLLSYAVYVACTIHVRNTAADANNNHNREHSSLLAASLTCLDELCLANPGVSKAVTIIKRLMEARRIRLDPEEAFLSNVSPASFDFDAIYSMFPMRDPNVMNDQYAGEVMFDTDLPDDPLFGLMDVRNMAFDDVPGPFVGSTSL